jgi:hypothetical protein
MAGCRKALIIAVDDYEHPGLRQLRSPAADAQALGAVLGDPRIGDFQVDVVRNQAAHEIQSHIEDLFCDAKADDLLLLHFSGHGLKGEAGDLFFAARNTRPNRLASTAIPADFVQRCIRTSPSRSIVLLLDCCYGGAFSQGVSVRATGDVHVLDSFSSGHLGGGRGRAVITASNAMEYAFEGERLSDDSQPTPSIFTAALVKGLRTGEADRDEDGVVSLNELYEYVFDRVREQNPNQTPCRDIEMQGELYLAKSGRRRLRPVPLPLDLRAAAEDANPYTRLGAIAELRSRLQSENLAVAAGAREALITIASSDTKQVAGAAKAAFGELVLRVTPTSLDFGPVPVGTQTTPQRVELSGPPLARHVTIHTSQPCIQIQDADAAYEVSVSPLTVGATCGTVTFSGAAGDAIVDVKVLGVIVAPGPAANRPGGLADPGKQPGQTARPQAERPPGTKLPQSTRAEGVAEPQSMVRPITKPQPATSMTPPVSTHPEPMPLSTEPSSEAGPAWDESEEQRTTSPGDNATQNFEAPRLSVPIPSDPRSRRQFAKLFVLLAGLFPRLALFIIWVARPALVASAFYTWIVPLLGITFLPFATLMYVILYIPGFGLTGWNWFFVILAGILDLAHLGASVARWREPAGRA